MLNEIHFDGLENFSAAAVDHAPILPGPRGHAEGRRSEAQASRKINKVGRNGLDITVRNTNGAISHLN